MADGLIERAMRWGENPSDIGSTTTEDRWLRSLHEFAANMILIAEGQVTAAQVKSYYNILPGSQDETDWNNMLAKNPGRANNTAKTNQAWWVIMVDSVMLAAEKRAPGYSTPAEVRTKLGIAQLS